MEVEKGHGRIEWRGIQVIEVNASQMGFPYAMQLARLDRWRFNKSSGKSEVETVWIITSLNAKQANAARLLELVRQYWSIENGLHYRLDVSGKEDQCRVRHPVSATVYGIVRRFVMGEYRAWAKRQLKARDRTYPTFEEIMGRRIHGCIGFLTGAFKQLPNMT
jgi:hypothetical protein